MATVDFTLEDMRRVVKEEVRVAIQEEVPPMVRGIIREEVPGIVAREFVNFWDTSLCPALDTMNDRIDELGSEMREVKHELKGVARLARRHSQDIMELRAAQ